MFNFVSVSHLLGRYPQVAENEAFFEWNRKHGAKVWHETVENDVVTVIVQSLDRLNLFVIQLKRDVDWAKPAQVTRTAAIDVLDTGVTRDQALVEHRAKLRGEEFRIHAVRPVVKFGDNEDIKLMWEIESISRDTKRTFDFAGPNELSERDDSALIIPAQPMVKPKADMIPPRTDWLGNNELHHLSSFYNNALTAIGSATTTQDKARNIARYVSLNYLYDANISFIGEFTWADILTRDTNGHRGICDEYAVVQVSMLRSLGIWSAIRFLVGTSGGIGWGHAVVEFIDGPFTIHMDGLWNAFNDPGIYRRSGVQSITVMDTAYPLDSRSDEPAWGIPDRRGDLMLHPYLDFLIAPAYPGNSRPGYSY